ncbi:hypothetical protein DH2020_027637 [Rehmannia glutinosa]|uniref:F-box domain-containing protein n=1 Tax=Rehmannia glutinosa TaxID=99300 RepID=A0ABR0VXG5_REHGL
MPLCSKSFDFLSCNYLLGLEDLTLDYCYGFEEFKLSSHSIKHLSILNDDKAIKAAIDAPNITDKVLGMGKACGDSIFLPAADGSMDRISELPQAILHHILSFLSQDEAAETSLLSKSWNYVWSTRPNIEFREKWFHGDKEKFMSVLNKTLQGYHDQNLCVHEFLVEMSRVDSEIVLLLEKWIPRVVLNMGVKKFSLYNYSKIAVYFDLPSVVFEAKALQKLYLYGCKLNPKPLDKVLFKHLKTLSLEQAYITDETFEKIISSCHLIEYVILDRCEGLRTIKVNENHKYLKDFQLKEVHDVSIEIDAPTLETFKIVCNVKWFHQHNYFPHLKSLYLYMVRLSSKSFDFFSCNFPCLEELRVYLCYGFKQFRLISRSIKHLGICGTEEQSIKATIDTPNIVEFEYEGDIPRSLSFTTTFSEWKSKIYLITSHASSSSWFLKLYDSLSQSEISLNLFQQYPPDRVVVEPDIDNIYGDGLCKPVVVEDLHLNFSRIIF